MKTFNLTIKWFAVILLITSITSCSLFENEVIVEEVNISKTYVLEIKGTLISNTTGQLLSGVRLNIKQNELGWGNGWDFHSSTVTNEDGTFSFTEELDKFATKLTIFSDLDSNQRLQSREIRFNYEDAINDTLRINDVYYLNELTTLQVNGTTDNPLQGYDKLRISFCNLDGCTCESVTTDNAIANAFNKISWRVIRGDEDIIYRDSIFCPLGETTIFNFEYE